MARMLIPNSAFRVTQRRLKRERIRSSDHLGFIRSLPCLVTGHSNGTQAAHISYEDLRYGKLGRGRGDKEDDCWTVPLSSDEHAIQHDMNEHEYWRERRIDPCRVALALYVHSGDFERAILILQSARN